MTHGQSTFRQCGDLVATIWMDKKPVTLLSTLASPSEITSVQRRRKDGSAIEVTCPKPVKLYNQYMSGVDKGDQQRGYYKVRCKSKKNYKYIFYLYYELPYLIQILPFNNHPIKGQLEKLQATTG